MDKKLQLENISFWDHEKPIFSGLNIDLHRGETLIVTGRSGSGKSTLLEISAGLKEPHEGSVSWDGYPIKSLTKEELIEARKKMGYLFQKHALIHNYPVKESLALPMRYHTSLSENQIKKRTSRQLDIYGISDVADKLPDHLSVAQARYAALARAMIMEPEIIYLDEPLSGMDPYACEKLVMMLKTLQQDKQLTIFIVCNSPHAFSEMECRICLLDHGALLDASFRNSHGMVDAKQLDIVLKGQV